MESKTLLITFVIKCKRITILNPTKIFSSQKIYEGQSLPISKSPHIDNVLCFLYFLSLLSISRSGVEAKQNSEERPIGPERAPGCVAGGGQQEGDNTNQLNNKEPDRVRLELSPGKELLSKLLFLVRIVRHTFGKVKRHNF